MFTVKFITNYPDGTVSQTSIICPNYAVYERADSYTITTYPTMTDEHGVDRYVAQVEQVTSDSEPPKAGTFGSCYVENSAGKTIDSFHVWNLKKPRGNGGTEITKITWK